MESVTLFVILWDCKDVSFIRERVSVGARVIATTL